jgi:hypothetical protein
MFSLPNYTFIGYHLSEYPKSSIFKPLEASQIKAGYGWKNSVSLHQFFKRYRDIDVEYSEEISTRKLGINAKEVMRESSLTFHSWIHEPSKIFPFLPLADTSSEMYLKLGYKRRRNEVDTSKASPQFLKHALNQDKLFCIKAGYSSNEFSSINFENGKCTDLSGEYCSDELNSKFLHLKAHHRRFIPFGDFRIQAHAKYDKIITLGGLDDVSINDRILLRNFKGVKDVGRKYYKNPDNKIVNEKSRMPVGDSLGHTSALELGVKITSTDLPYFKLYQLEERFWTARPFLFANVAILPDEMKEGQSLVENMQQSSVASAGFGIQFIHYLAACELYYSVAVHKHDYEFGAELQFNFGLD